METAETLYLRNLDTNVHIMNSPQHSEFLMEDYYSTYHHLAGNEADRLYTLFYPENSTEDSLPTAHEWESIKFHWKSIIISASLQTKVLKYTPLTMAQIFSLLATIDGMKPEHYQEGARFLTDKVMNLYNKGVRQMEDITSPHIKRAIQIIHQNHKSRDLRLKTVAKELSLSPPYLSNLFQENTGESITTYIHKTKVEASLEHLLFTSLSVHEIAEEYGYTSTTTFCRKFKELKGLSHLQYRKKHSI